LSGGGPIIHPEAPVFVINPICPHTLSHRPMVIPDASRIEIDIQRSSKRQLFVIDGQDHHRVLQGDRIEIRRGPRPVRLLHPPDYSYFNLLRQKLHLRGSTV
jgi:NAD+ kinase